MFKIELPIYMFQTANIINFNTSKCVDEQTFGGLCFSALSRFLASIASIVVRLTSSSFGISGVKQIV